MLATIIVLIANNSDTITRNSNHIHYTTATILNINNITNDEKNNIYCLKLNYPVPHEAGGGRGR